VTATVVAVAIVTVNSDDGAGIGERCAFLGRGGGAMTWRARSRLGTTTKARRRGMTRFDRTCAGEM
jgi:hypothetical protein